MDFPITMTIEDLFEVLYDSRKDGDEALERETRKVLRARTNNPHWWNTYLKWEHDQVEDVDETLEAAAAALEDGETDPGLVE